MTQFLTIKLWRGPNVAARWEMNPEGRMSINILPELGTIDRITVEPYNPDSKVEMMSYGAKYTP